MTYQFVMDYLSTCDVCCQSRIPRHQPYRLQPLPIPLSLWKSIFVNFITNLPSSKGYDVILTVVDRITKMTLFLPCRKTFTSYETTNLLMQEVVKRRGIPD